LVGKNGGFHCSANLRGAQLGGNGHEANPAMRLHGVVYGVAFGCEPMLAGALEDSYCLMAQERISLSELSSEKASE
jgi:hypothetical protein